jgi:hypothetical protein
MISIILLLAYFLNQRLKYVIKFKNKKYENNWKNYIGSNFSIDFIHKRRSGKGKATSTKPVNSAPVKVEYRKLTAPSKKASIENRSKIVQPIKKEVSPRNTIKE